MNTSSRWQWACLGASATGWLISGYLWTRHRALGEGATVGTDICSALGGGGCDFALLSPSTSIYGVPLPALGLMYFAVVTLLVALSIPLANRVALLVTAGGVGASVVLSVHLFQLEIPVCILCLAIHALNVLLLGCIVGLQRSLTGTEAEAAPTRSRIVLARRIAASAMLVVGGSLQALLLWIPDSGAAEEDFLTAFLDSPMEPALAEAWAGAEDVAPALLVVFSSFECPGCQTVASRFKYLETQFGADLEIEYRHFPLSSECNGGVPVNLQPHACASAYAAEAARNQDAFGPYHDRLFAGNLHADDADLQKIARELNLDIERWERDRHSEDVKARIAQDTALGTELGIAETPTVYLNGRQVRHLGQDALVQLVDQEIRLAPLRKMYRESPMLSPGQPESPVQPEGGTSWLRHPQSTS